MPLLIDKEFEDGRWFTVTTSANGGLAAIVPAALLDEQVGPDACQDTREEWILEHGAQIEAAMINKSEGRPVTQPFALIELGARL